MEGQAKSPRQGKALDGGEIRQSQQMLFDLLSTQDEKLDRLTDFVRSSSSEHAKRIEALAGGFPDGDPIGHCRYHEAEISRIEARAEFWLKLRLSVTQWGLIGFLGWAAVSLWQEFLRGPK